MLTLELNVSYYVTVKLLLGYNEKKKIELMYNYFFSPIYRRIISKTNLFWNIFYFTVTLIGLKNF